MTDLTQRQADVVQFVRDYIAEQHYSPSIRDVAAWFQITPNAALGHINAIEAKGGLVRSPGIARSLRLGDGVRG